MTRDKAAQDGNGLWHVLCGPGRVSMCGKPLPQRYNFAHEQELAGAGERCLVCAWREPPRFLRALTNSEREYLDCIADVDLAKDGRLRSDHFERRVDEASVAWGWGVDSAENRRALATMLVQVAEEIGDGTDEIVEARRRLTEARKERSEVLRSLNQKVEEEADTLSLLEQQLRIAIACNGKRKR